MEETTDYFSRLPDEVFLKILSYFDHDQLELLSRISHKFRRLSLDPILWTCNKTLRRDHMTTDQFEQLVRLRLQRSTLLKKLDLTGYFTRESHEKSPDYTSLAIFALQHCPTLESLTLCRFGKLKPLLEAIEEHGQSLSTLYLSYNFSFFEEGDLADTPGCLQNLTTLGYWGNISDRDLRTVADHCKRGLQELSCSGTALSEDALKYFLEASNATLRCLDLSGRARKKALKHVGTCQKLEELSAIVEMLLPEEIEAISTLKGLKRLRLEFIECQANKVHFKRAFVGERLSRLTSLSLCRCYAGDVTLPSPVDDEVLDIVAKNCPSLVNFELRSLVSVTDVGIGFVVERCRLQRLHLEDMAGLTEAVLAGLPTPGMRQLIVVHCGNIRAKAVNEAKQRCASLE